MRVAVCGVRCSFTTGRRSLLITSSAVERTHGLRSAHTGWHQRRAAPSRRITESRSCFGRARVCGQRRPGASEMGVVDHETLIGCLTRLQSTAQGGCREVDDAARCVRFPHRAGGVAHRRTAHSDWTFKIAPSPAVCVFADFDFKTQPSIDQRQMRELVTSRWIPHGDGRLLPGPPGAGKTHSGNELW